MKATAEPKQEKMATLDEKAGADLRDSGEISSIDEDTKLAGEYFFFLSDACVVGKD